ncbi:MAG: hypothetical protein AAF614_09910 [Chloroflexota bacterium]
MFTEFVHRKKKQSAFKIGSYLLVLTGSGHSATELIAAAVRSEAAYNEFVAVMPTIDLLGRSQL